MRTGRRLDTDKYSEITKTEWAAFETLRRNFCFTYFRNRWARRRSSPVNDPLAKLGSMKTEAAAMLHIVCRPAGRRSRAASAHRVSTRQRGARRDCYSSMPYKIQTMFSSQYCASTMVNQHYPNHYPNHSWVTLWAVNLCGWWNVIYGHNACQNMNLSLRPLYSSEGPPRV